MKIQNVIKKHQVKLRHAFKYRFDYDNKSIALDDQEEACKHECLAYLFATLKIPGTDIKKCQNSACKDPSYAYYFARDIPEVIIDYCQEHACKDPVWAFYFARNVQGADIAYCRQACEFELYWLREFDKMIFEKQNLNV